MRTRSQTTILGLIAAFALTVTACSGGGETEEPSPEPMETEAAEPIESAEPMEEDEPEEEVMGDEYFILTVGDQTIEFTTINWCQEDDGDWNVTATGDGRKRDISIDFQPSNPPASSLVINLDNADTFVPADPAQKWKASSIEGTVNGNTGSGTATLETEVGDPPPSTEAQWEFTCSP